MSGIAEDREAHTDSIAERFADDVMKLVEALVEAGVDNVVIAPIVLQVVDFIAHAYDLGLHDGADILEQTLAAKFLQGLVKSDG